MNDKKNRGQSQEPCNTDLSKLKELINKIISKENEKAPNAKGNH